MSGFSEEGPATAAGRSVTWVSTSRARAIATLALIGSLLAVLWAPSAADATRVGQLTDDQLAGLRVIYSYPAFDPPQALLDQIEDGEVGGVILFGQNVQSRPQVEEVSETLQEAAEESPIDEPFIISTDQEGGVVKRIPGKPRLSAKQVGVSEDSRDVARRMGKGAGNNLSHVGVNLNLAPVLGVFREPADFLDQFGRSFSDNQFKVRRLGSIWLRAQQRRGVAATAKHYPGLGAASNTQNTDSGPVTLNLSLNTIRSVDEFPYSEAIDDGVEVVMPSWGTYPALDPARPAGLSPVFIQDELRDREDFDGVIITDALEAAAAAPFGTIAQRTVLAADAGNDLLLASDRTVAEGDQAQGALVDALDDGTLDRQAFKASARRILDLRSRLGEPLEGP